MDKDTGKTRGRTKTNKSQQVFSGAISGLETVGGNIAEAAKKTMKNAGKLFGKFGGKFQSGFSILLTPCYLQMFFKCLIIATHL
jgi:hypothetical protein